MRLVGVQCQAYGRDPLADGIQRQLGFVGIPAQNHKVICVTHHLKARLVHEVIQWVEVDVGKQGGLVILLRLLSTLPRGNAVTTVGFRAVTLP